MPVDDAVAASMLTAAYHMLEDGTDYQDRGSNPVDQRSKEAQTRRLADLGYAVEISPLSQAA